MIFLPLTLDASSAQNFTTTLKKELESLTASDLPLQKGLSQSSYVSDEPFHILPLSHTCDAHSLYVRIGVSYSGIIAGCSCADDPTPQDLQTEYCELLLTINTQTAAATFELTTD